MVGCSPSTVSKAIHGYKTVSDELREKILAVIKQEGYQPNLLAQSLVSKRSQSAALIVPDISEPVLSSICLSAEKTLMQHGYVSLLCNTNYDLQTEKNIVNHAINRGVDGLIIRPVSNDLDYLFNLDIPIMLVSYTYHGALSFVDIENEEAGFIATKHLIDCGYNRIAFISGPGTNYTSLRQNGYEKALEKSGLCGNKEYIFPCENSSVQDGIKVAKMMLDADVPPDGFFCNSDRIAMGVLEYLRVVGYVVPEDFGIIGFNDDDYSSFPQLDLTTIRQPKQRIGEIAANNLLDFIRNPTDRQPRHTKLYPELIVRSTTRNKGSK